MMRPSVVILASLIATACGERSAARWSDAERASILRLELPVDLAAPADPTNRVANDPKAAALGQALFFDTSLSSSGRFACATCHAPSKDFADSLALADGLRPGRRNTPSVLGRTFSTWLFWDGRKDSLWSQALGPFENPIEHNFTRLEVVRQVLTTHAQPYQDVFGAPALDLTDANLPLKAKPDPEGVETDAGRAWKTLTAEQQDAINRAFSNIGKTIAAYERRLIPQRSSFDLYAAAVRRGEDPTDVLSPQALDGLRLFVGKANCIACHDSPLLTDNSFHNLGIPPRPDEESPDSGRLDGAKRVLADEFNCGSPYSDDAGACRELRFLDPSFPDFDGAFRTPSLRDVAKTAPYMHAGQIASLADVIRFYSDLPGTPQLGHRELTLRPLALTATEQAQLVAFLESLTGDSLPDELTKAP